MKYCLQEKKNNSLVVLYAIPSESQKKSELCFTSSENDFSEETIKCKFHVNTQLQIHVL